MEQTMIRILLAMLLALSLGAVVPAEARAQSHSTKSHSVAAPKAPKAVAGVKRDANGKIARSSSAKNSFKKQQPCPANGNSKGACPGFVIDHIKPLKRGGADAPSNMQWQTKAAAKAKDKVE